MNRDQRRALGQTLNFLKAEGKSHQGYFYSGWAGLQLRELLAEGRQGGAARQPAREPHWTDNAPVINPVIDPAKAHLAAAEAWGHVADYMGQCNLSWELHLKHCSFCQGVMRKASDATGSANEATQAADPNTIAFDATSAALLASSMIKPAAAAAAHRRAAAAYEPKLTTPEDMDEALRHLEELGLVEAAMS